MFNIYCKFRVTSESCILVTKTHKQVTQCNMAVYIITPLIRQSVLSCNVFTLLLNVHVVNYNLFLHERETQNRRRKYNGY